MVAPLLTDPTCGISTTRQSPPDCNLLFYTALSFEQIMQFLIWDLGCPQKGKIMSKGLNPNSNWLVVAA